MRSSVYDSTRVSPRTAAIPRAPSAVGAFGGHLTGAQHLGARRCARRHALARLCIAVAVGIWLGSAAACGTSPPAEPSREEQLRGVAPLIESAGRSRSSGDYTRAIELYREAFERTPWNERLGRALAVTYAEKAIAERNEGKMSAAEADLREAVGLFPDDLQFRRNLAVVLLERATLELEPDEAQALVAEIRALDPEAKIPERIGMAGFERRMDLAFDLVSKNQLEAGIDQLERIHRDYPEEPAATRLLAQAHVRQATQFSTRQNYPAAGEELDRAVALYDALAPCAQGDVAGARCSQPEREIAHRNRIIAWMNARQDDVARKALAKSRAQGFSFADLERELDRF